jgi:putative transposase
MPLHLRRYDEPGHVHFWTLSCYPRLTFFWYDPVKMAVAQTLDTWRKQFRICLIGYVIMPEHLHILFYPHARGSDDPTPVSRLLHSFKRDLDRKCKEPMRYYWRQHGQLWSKPLTAWARGELGRRVIMHKRGHDFNVDRYDTMKEKLDYCHKNPITRGLVERPEDWEWSSFRYYEFDDPRPLRMDWDGQWPIIW